MGRELASGGCGGGDGGCDTLTLQVGLKHVRLAGGRSGLRGPRSDHLRARSWNTITSHPCWGEIPAGRLAELARAPTAGKLGTARARPAPPLRAIGHASTGQEYRRFGRDAEPTADRGDSLNNVRVSGPCHSDRQIDTTKEEARRLNAEFVDRR